mmetsp:Transcript_95728/g.270929  ORF Transcript_95728/g.270929 Transcript_95728/m.270929 type:complete len:652 (+) Transcript_95728:198-2153(+)
MRPGARKVVAGAGSTAVFCPAGVLSRALCCLGALVLVQNITVLHLGSQLFQEGFLPKCGDAAGDHAAPESASSAKPRSAAEDGVAVDSSILKELRAQLAKEAEHVATLEAQLKKQQQSATDAARMAGEVRARDLRIEALNAQMRQMSKDVASASVALPSSSIAASPVRLPAVAVNSLDAGGAAAAADYNPRQLQRESSLFTVPREQLRLFGQDVPTTVQIAVGFGSVSRKKNYVLETVGLMLGLRGDTAITAAERGLVVIVAHLADFNTSWVSYISGRLQTDYPDLVSSGHLHGLHAAEELYPKVDVCPPFCAYKDDPHRVKWRSKQNVDYAFLMYYAAPLAPYYLQIEDDIVFAPHWISTIAEHLRATYPPNFLSKENAPWRLIDFSQLGFIGKLFQSNELTRLAQFLLLFYDQMPCDLLLGEWAKSMTQGKKIEYWKQHASLFQHAGIFRSLGGFQPLQEKRFGKKMFDNPQGVVVWNYTIVPTYEGKFAYSPAPEPDNRNDACDYKASPAHNKVKLHRCWFWTKTVEAFQHITVVFRQDIALRAVFVELGHEKHPKDLLLHGVVQVADSSHNPGSAGVLAGFRSDADVCGGFYHLIDVQKQNMVYWEEGTSTPAKLPVPRVRCLRLMALQSQAEWVAVQQIQVRTAAS